MEYKKKIDEREFLYDRWHLFEQAYCLRSPAHEAEFVFDNRSALGLYDCVIPQLKEHRKLEVTQDLIAKNRLVDDLKMKKEVYALEKERDEKKLVESEAKNLRLTKVNKQLKVENS